MKKVVTIMVVLMVCSMAFAQSGLNAIGGINYSTVAGDDVENADNLLGFRFGVEKTLTNGLIAGAIYSQRGFSDSESDEYGEYSYDNEITLNYLAGYVLKPFPIQTGVDILAGAELGYFLNGKVKTEFCYDGDCESDTEDIDGDDWEDEDSNKIDYGIVVGGRYAINQQISLVGTYFFGLANLDDDDFEMKNRSFQINVSYGF
ncbi:MAG: PorT family protein [Candidatus Marinimicrobia bacterium]|nr:PorT family protein [Candidatus Neomarinimicrobiota bacterium]